MSCEDMSTLCGVCDVDKLSGVDSVPESIIVLENGILQTAPYKLVHGFVVHIPENCNP